MPGIDFDKLRAEITMEQVLTLLEFEPLSRSGSQWHGRCPLHDATSPRSSPFSVNIAVGRYYCHQCHSHGNQLDLWAAFINMPLHPASIKLCHVLNREVPWIRRW